VTKVQFIKTTGGEERAVLPKSEYERLAALATDEDVGTARLVRKARAAVADISQSYLSDLEKGRRRGTAQALARIARALKVPLDLLVQ
jgi:transcriptional regulator with XRE-family HTH domain